MSIKRRSLRVWLVAALVAATIGGGIWLWKEVLEDRLIPKRFGVVEAGLIYRSGQLSQYLVRRTLADHDIRVIVDLTGVEPDSPDEQAEIAAADKLGIERHVFPLGGDGRGDITAYVEAIKLIHRAVQEKQPVLVHCAAGSQRTGAAIAFYRVLIQGESPREAEREMADYGWSARKNHALLEYMDTHMAELAEKLVAEHVIDRVPDPLPVMSR